MPTHDLDVVFGTYLSVSEAQGNKLRRGEEWRGQGVGLDGQRPDDEGTEG